MVVARRSLGGELGMRKDTVSSRKDGPAVATVIVIGLGGSA